MCVSILSGFGVSAQFGSLQLYSLNPPVHDAIVSMTRRVDGYLETLQYRLEESVSHRRTRQVTQLLTFTDA